MDKKHERDFADLEVKRLYGGRYADPRVALGTGKAAGQGKGAAPYQPEPGTGGAVTKKRCRPIHIHVTVSEEELALIQERMAEAEHPQYGSLCAENSPQWLCAPC